MGDNITKYFFKSHNVVDTLKIFKDVKPVINEFLGKESDFITTLTGKKEYEKICKSPEANHLLAIQCLYLNIFKKLFISGNYDKYLPDGSPDIKEIRDII